MSKRTTVARHRATPAATSGVDVLSQAVSANAGNMGRQAAVVAAASGLVLTIGAPAANATPVQTARDTSTLPAAGLDLERTSKETTLTVADAEEEIEVNRAELSSQPAPEPEPEPEVEPVTNDVEPVTNDNVNEQAPEQQSQQAEQTETQESQESVETSSNETAEQAQTQEAPASSASGSLGAVVSAAYSGVGNAYVFGGKTPAGWDCSGFTAWAYAQAGIDIPSSTSALLGSGQFQRTSSPQAGDLVFQNGGSHVGIYVGNGQMIGAQNPSVGTILHSVDRNPLMGYYTYVG